SRGRNAAAIPPAGASYIRSRRWCWWTGSGRRNAGSFGGFPLFGAAEHPVEGLDRIVGPGRFLGFCLRQELVMPGDRGVDVGRGGPPMMPASTKAAPVGATIAATRSAVCGLTALQST